MEGNFYVAQRAIDNPLRSTLYKHTQACAEPMRRYGKCVEVASANREVKKSCCVEERRAMMQCVQDMQHKTRRAKAVELGE